MAKLVVESFGVEGVNVDLNPLELRDSQLVQAQNAISDPRAGASSLIKRPGLLAVTLEDTAGVVLGGINLPLTDLAGAGVHYVFVGRGPVV